MAVIVLASAMTMGSCHIYKKFELPEEGLSAEIAAAQKEETDSTAFGNTKKAPERGKKEVPPST